MTFQMRSRWPARLAVSAGMICGVLPVWAQGPGGRGGTTAVTGAWSDATLSPDRRAELLAGQMTIEEKISIVHGGGFSFGAPAPGAQASAAEATGPGGFGRGTAPFDIRYQEGLKVGYKWFDAGDKTPLFAFGHGLSYTTFAYSAPLSETVKIAD